jgi:alpha-N-arabinofuranosidase
MAAGKIRFDKYFSKGGIGRRLYGSFVEHLGRCLYGGIYEPSHPSADERGFRGDVKELIRELGISTIRYPGGNFVSGYNWKDGIGLREKRPTRKDMAWNRVEPNHVGTDEFAAYCRDLDVELIMTANLGTGTPMEAGELVDYCNNTGGTYWSDLRRSHGAEKAHDVMLWCLGNEMDGEWQIAALKPEEYAGKAKESAKIMRWMDPRIKLIACGSCSNEIYHKTFGEWDMAVAEEAYDYIEYLSLHRYYNYRPGLHMFYPMEDDISDIPFFFKDIQDFIDTVVSVCDFIKGKNHKDKSLMISFDEYGIMADAGKVPGTEGTGYSYAKFNQLDAVIYGGILCTFINNSDRVKIACQSLLANEMGFISTDPSGKAIRQAPFYVLKDITHYAIGEALRISADLPSIPSNHHGMQKAVTMAGSYDRQSKKLRVFAANCDLENDYDIVLEFGSFEKIRPVFHSVLFSEDWKVSNSFESEDLVKPRRVPLDSAVLVNGGITVKFQKHSWNVIEFEAE